VSQTIIEVEAKPLNRITDEDGRQAGLPRGARLPFPVHECTRCHDLVHAASRTCVLSGPGAAEIDGWMVGQREQKKPVCGDDIDVGVVGWFMGEGEVTSIWGLPGLLKRRRPAI